MNSEPIQVELDVNLKIFQPTEGQPLVSPVQLLPHDPLFYQVSVGEVLREKQRQKDLLEKEQMLRTKAMRIRDEKSHVNTQYKYTVLRIRMPDEIILQVIFRSNALLSSLFEFLRSYCLEHNWLSFTLRSNADRRLYSSEDELSMTFTQCDLVPTALLSFQWNDHALREVKQQAPNFPTNIYLKSEVLINAARL
jgi:UBX domain-containing protein 6